jgi:hypothetical protein
MKTKYRIVLRTDVAVGGLPKVRHVLEVRELCRWIRLYGFESREEAESAQREWERHES